MDERGDGHRVNRVRYYRFSDFEKALAAVVEDRATAEAVRGLFP